MNRKSTFLKKRIIAIAMSALMIAGPVEGAVMTVYAVPTITEDTETNRAGYRKLSDYVLEYGEKAEDELGRITKYALSDKTYVAVDESEMDNLLIMGAKAGIIENDEVSTEANEIKLSISEDLNDCEIEYLFELNGKEMVYTAKVPRNELTEDNFPELQLKSGEAPENLETIVNAEVKKLFFNIIKEWDEQLNDKAGVNLAELGLTGFFTSDEKCDDSTEESDGESVEENLSELTETTLEETESEISETETITEETSEEITTEALSEESIEETTDEDASEENTICETSDMTETEELELEEALAVVPTQRIGLNLKDADVYEGDKIKIIANVFPENSSETVTFSSSDDAIASVTEEGIVQGKLAGDAVITVKSGTATVTCQVHVYEDEKKGEDISDVISIADGIYIAGFEDSLTYTGTKVTQNIRVYDRKKLLKEKTDYTIAYANNINSAPADIIKSPSMTITLKGQYSGKRTLYFAIAKRDLAETTITTDGIALTYNKREQKHIPIVMYGSKKLANKTDFSIEYFYDEECNHPATSSLFTGNTYGRTIVYYRLTAAGNNFSGTKTGSYNIVGTSENLSKAAVRLTGTLKYMGVPLTNNELMLSMTLPGTKVAVDPIDDAEYDVSFMDALNNPINLSDIDTPGTYTVRIKSNNYSVAGYVEKKFKVISGNNLAKLAEVDGAMWLDEIPFNKAIAEESADGIIQPDKQYLKAKDDVEIPGGNTIKKGVDYTVTYANNRKAGVAKVTFKGAGRFSGNIVKTFKIAGSSITANVASTATYLTGGAAPDITVVDEYGTELVPKKDYVVTCKNNTKVGIANYKIVGKGNYAKSEIINGEGTYEITVSDLKNCSVVIADKVYSPKANAYKAVPVIYDTNGKKLVPGKDYDKNYEYFYPGSETNDAPEAETVINVKITGLGNFEGSEVYGYYKIYDKLTGVAKLVIAIDNQDYTGRVIEPELYDKASDKGDIHVYLNAANKKNGIEEDAADYVRIVSYSNNIKAGVGRVTLAGVGAYGGTKVVTFKIQKRGMLFAKADKVILDSSGLTGPLLPGVEGQDEATLFAYVEPNDALNRTLVWTTSNANIIRIKSAEYKNIDGIYGSEVKIEAVGNGSATIKVTSQETGKAASVKVTAQKKPITSIKINKSSITLDSGESEVLSCTYYPADAYASKIIWYSTNESVATVEADGTVTAKHGGIAYIVVKDNDKPTGVSDRCLVKVNEDISEMINVVTGYGAVPNDNNTDNSDFDAFNKALKQADITGKTVYVPAGTYDITAKNSVNNSLRIAVMDNVSIVMDKDAVLKAIPNNEQESRVVWIASSNNISITGGTIVGDLGSTKSGGEGCHGVKIVGSKNVVFSGVNIRSCYSDAVYIDGGNGNPETDNVEFINCNLSNCGRHCVSFVNSKNVTFKNCNISNTRAHGCVDIEANGYGRNDHIKFIGGSISVGGGAVIAILNAASDIEISGTALSGGYIENRSGVNVRYNGTIIPADGSAWWPN